MAQVVLSFFAGVNVAIAIIAFYLAKKIGGQRFYYYFGIFSLFSALYFFFATLNTEWNNSYPLVIICAGIYYGIFPWFIFDFIGKKYTAFKVSISSIFVIAIVLYMAVPEGGALPIWQITAHIGLVFLIAISAYAAYNLYRRELSGAKELILLTLVFGLLGIEEIISQYTSLDLLKPIVTGMQPLDIYPVLFTIIFGLRLSNDLVDSQRLRFKLMQSEIKEKKYDLELLEKKRIENELKSKSKDLTEFGLDLVRKKEFTEVVYQKILEIKKSNPGIIHLTKLLKLVKSHLQIDNELDYFHKNIDSVNNHFLSQLQSEFPSLSKNELQIASMLRIGLSSKQIATIKNISPDSVKVLRYRLRKKLKLSQNQDLIRFMQDFD